MWKSAELLQATSGTLQGSAFEAASVSIDSRKLAVGSLFVAFKGERFDGHDYLAEAFAQGAVAALVHRIPDNAPKGCTLIIVKDTYEALVAMGHFARARTKAVIIGVTGSVGKTGTKEAIAVAAHALGNVYATKGNLNNHIGLPLSLANLPANAKMGIFELGMNHAGEIAFLTKMARPHIALITNFEAVHLEFFDNVEAIADAKAEIMQGLEPEGTLILNHDNRFFERLLDQANKNGVRHILTFGAHEKATCRLLQYVINERGSVVEALIEGTPVQYQLGTMGRQYAITSLAALAAVSAAGLDLADAAAALAHFREPEGRGRICRIALMSSTATLIDDCYNASPVSMKAGIEKLTELHIASNAQGRKIAVLGDMLELGTESSNLHKELLGILLEQGIDKVYTAGPLMQQLYDILPTAMRAGCALTSAALIPMLKSSLNPGDTVLLKGSYGSRMSVIRDALLATSRTSSRETLDAV